MLTTFGADRFAVIGALLATEHERGENGAAVTLPPAAYVCN
jgi:hypothetical protein